MTPLNDSDLIDRLSSAISERQAGIAAPERLGADARRTARRRAATRAVAGGVPVLAAAGVATVLATSSGGSQSTGPSGSVTAQSTSFVVAHVKARLAEADEHGLATHGGSFADSSEGADGSLSLGKPYVEEYDYTAPDGTTSYHETFYTDGGTPRLIVSNVRRPDGRDRSIQINPIDHTYSRHEYSGTSGDRDPSPDLSSSPAQIRDALQRGTVTQLGTTTVNGTSAIALAVRFNEPAGATPTSRTLYVDSETYRPLRLAQSVLVPGDRNVSATDWVPATADTIARATDDSIPSGYRRVDRAY